MREIKFRAWDIKKQKMAYNIQDEYDSCCGVRYWVNGEKTEDSPDEDSFGSYLYSGYEIMQYTGLKDKNGKDIYEGDIIKTNRTGDGFMEGEIIDIQIVEYINERAGFKPFIIQRDFSACGYHELDWEIIGNIYENPELL